jgi:hypothetical protein
MKFIENCFLCFGLMPDVVSAASFRSSQTQTEILLSRTTSEFSHSLDPKQTFGPDQPSMLKSTLSLAASIHRSRIADGINIVTAEFGRTLAKYRRFHEAE